MAKSLKTSLIPIKGNCTAELRRLSELWTELMEAFKDTNPYCEDFANHMLDTGLDALFHDDTKFDALRDKCIPWSDRYVSQWFNLRIMATYKARLKDELENRRDQASKDKTVQLQSQVQSLWEEMAELETAAKEMLFDEKLKTLGFDELEAKYKGLLLRST